MYEEIFFIIIVFSLIIYMLRPNHTVYIAATNGNKYKVQFTSNEDMQQEKVKILCELDSRIRKFLKFCKENELPNQIISERLCHKMEKIEIREIPENEKGAGYTINKGHIYLCLYDEEKGELNNIEDIMFVLMHELGHIASVSFGHGEEFKKNFDFIVKLCAKLKLWNTKDYSKESVTICGIEVTHGNCDNKECTKSNLDLYFKESLLD